jgi:hypothetical protein
MSYSLAPSTELDAVNEILAAIGEAPVNQLDNLGLTDAATARTRLYDASRRCQKRGWAWNTDFNMSLPPANITGFVWLPSSCLKVTFTGNSADKNLVQRGTQIYDADNHTYVFTTPVTADVVNMLDWTLLPEAARQFIFLTAIVRFQAGFIGSDVLDKYTTRDVTQAWSDLLSEELEVADWNMLRDSNFMQEALNRISTGNVGYPDLD